MAYHIQFVAPLASKLILTHAQDKCLFLTYFIFFIPHPITTIKNKGVAHLCHKLLSSILVTIKVTTPIIAR